MLVAISYQLSQTSKPAISISVVIKNSKLIIFDFKSYVKIKISVRNRNSYIICIITRMLLGMNSIGTRLLNNIFISLSL